MINLILMEHLIR